VDDDDEDEESRASRRRRTNDGRRTTDRAIEVVSFRVRSRVTSRRSGSRRRRRRRRRRRSHGDRLRIGRTDIEQRRSSEVGAESESSDERVSRVANARTVAWSRERPYGRVELRAPVANTDRVEVTVSRRTRRSAAMRSRTSAREDGSAATSAGRRRGGRARGNERRARWAFALAWVLAAFTATREASAGGGGSPPPPPKIDCTGGWQRVSFCKQLCGPETYVERYQIYGHKANGGKDCEEADGKERRKQCNNRV